VTTSTQQSAIGATRFTHEPAKGGYPGITRLRLGDGKHLCMCDVGPHVEAALLAGEAEMLRLLAKLDEIPATEVRQ